jgi:hypothetical protein
MSDAPRDEGPFSSPVSQRDGTSTSGCATVPSPLRSFSASSPARCHRIGPPTYGRMANVWTPLPSSPADGRLPCPTPWIARAGEGGRCCGPLRFVVRRGDQMHLALGHATCCTPPLCWEWHAPCEDGLQGQRIIEVLVLVERRASLISSPWTAEGRSTTSWKGKSEEVGRGTCRVLVGAT